MLQIYYSVTYKKVTIGGLKKMTKIFEKEATIRKASKNRQKSLILHIPPVIRDYMELQADEQIIISANLDAGERYIKIKKKID